MSERVAVAIFYAAILLGVVLAVALPPRGPSLPAGWTLAR